MTKDCEECGNTNPEKFEEDFVDDGCGCKDYYHRCLVCNHRNW